MSVFKESTTHKTPALDVTHVRPSARRVLRAQYPAEARGDAAPKNILIAAVARSGKFLYIHFLHSARVPLLFLINAGYRSCFRGSSVKVISSARR